ncbi:hypothetical protein niasHT_020163 [Heterodera trifolii]|uniref:Uncharacterized protein n=1 Tax=Heterodera trifolii TaxID=157864 RepID=A0ABD2KHZ6_9BILA
MPRGDNGRTVRRHHTTMCRLRGNCQHPPLPPPRGARLIDAAVATVISSHWTRGEERFVTTTVFEGEENGRGGEQKVLMGVGKRNGRTKEGKGRNWKKKENAEEWN